MFYAFFHLVVDCFSFCNLPPTFSPFPCPSLVTQLTSRYPFLHHLNALKKERYSLSDGLNVLLHLFSFLPWQDNVTESFETILTHIEFALCCWAMQYSLPNFVFKMSEIPVTLHSVRPYWWCLLKNICCPWCGHHPSPSHYQWEITLLM